MFYLNFDSFILLKYEVLIMCTALGLRVFVAGLALQFSFFMDRVAAKDGSNPFAFYFLASFYCVFTPSPPGVTSREEQ